VSRVYVHSVAAMGTVVTIQAIGEGDPAGLSSGAENAESGHRGEAHTRQADNRAAIVARALDWFLHIEGVCSRFDARSELHRLCAQVGTPVPVSELLFQAVRFALAVAAETDGAFDPTVGRRMEQMGFNTDFRTGSATVSNKPASEGVAVRGLTGTGAEARAPVHDATVRDGPRGRSAAANLSGDAVTFRDVVLDPDAHTIVLRKPLLLDVGAVAKGLAIDLAARELRPIGNFAIDAGGDLYLGGCNEEGMPWRVGIRHPRREGEVIETLHLSNVAVCTSGDYERRAGNQDTADFLTSDDAERDNHHTEGAARPIRAEQGMERPAHDDGAAHHIIDARTGRSASRAVSATVLAESAMVADALATAAFVLGPEAGIRLLDVHGVDGVIVTPTLERFATRGMRREYVKPRPESIGVE
jgi:FAD:protein FMN transferase